MDANRLWAKSQRKGEVFRDGMTLPGHLDDVHRAAIQVLAATATDQLDALGLKEAEYGERFRRLVRLAAAVHDLGKANDHFQGMICKSPKRQNRPQGVRHEWITVLLLQEPALRSWLVDRTGSEADCAFVEWAVGSHHPAYQREAPPRRAEPRGAGDQLTAYTTHSDFRRCLDWLAETFGGTIPAFDRDKVYELIGSERVDAQFVQWYRTAATAWEDMLPDERKLVSAVKACLIAADVAGSAIPERIADSAKRDVWISDAFKNRPLSGELDELVERRLSKQRKKEFDPPPQLRPFQEAVGASAAQVTYVRAGCGSGKTLAAYHWAAKQHPGRRLYFCYPTTGTATEGFKDYLYNPDAESNYRLFHGRADVDLADLLATGGDESKGEADLATRIESLDAWGTPVVSCTVDTVLGLVQNARRGLYSWPALAGAAFVFDEIHAYDDKLFGALLRFLQTVPGVPVLLMTASLPEARKTSLNNCLARAKREPMVEVPGPNDLEIRKRYIVEPAPSDIAARVRQEYDAGGKVLWVSNTVKRAMTAASTVADYSPKVYHSRFRYIDRKEQHESVVNAFKANQTAAAIACCTQVAEMSLDLKGTTLLVTELAPVPALIQRLGRLNRDAEEGDPPRPFIVIDVGDDHLPYTPDELDSAREWLKTLGNQPLSQSHLATAWQMHDKSHKPDFVASAWLDGGPSTAVLELREASPGITVVMKSDADAVNAGEIKLSNVVIPMPPPRGRAWRNWSKLKGGIPVAPSDSIKYDPKEGATWQE